jgi:hypothetical protein
MKLNDPFGRMANRHQLGYESMRETMRSSGINTTTQALEVIVQSKKRAVNYAMIVVAGLLLVTLFAPNLTPITLSLGLFFIVWIATSAVNGQRYIQRYIDEELKTETNSD